MSTRCVLITIQTHTQERGLYQASLSLSLGGEEEAGALSMLALKVLTVSESREGFSKLSFADALYDTVPRK